MLVPGVRLQGSPPSLWVGGWPDRSLWQTDTNTEREEGMGRSRGPERSRERGWRPSRGGTGQERCESRRAGTRQLGWPVAHDKRQRDGETRRPKETEAEWEGAKRPPPRPAVPSSVPSLGAGPAKRTPPPARQPVRLLVCPLPARRPPAARAGKAPTAPWTASLLPLSHFLLLSLCQTHLELFKPKYSAPSPLQPDSSTV